MYIRKACIGGGSVVYTSLEGLGVRLSHTRITPNLKPLTLDLDPKP